MSTEVIVAIVGALATIIVAVIVAMESSRRFSVSRENNLIDKIEDTRKDLAGKIESNTRQLICIALKADTLWEIYGEEVIRNARNAGMIATRSAEAPTAEWSLLVTDDLVTEIEDRATTLAYVLDSPYDIFVEVWKAHKEELVRISRDKNVSISTVTSGVLQICGNALA